MGFRFRKSIRLMPGVRINLSKSGVSTSIGRRGFMWNSRGTFTAGIPGSGLSYRFNLNEKSSGTAASSLPPPVATSVPGEHLSEVELKKKQIARTWWLVIACLVVLVVMFPFLLIVIGLIPVIWLVKIWIDC